MVDCVYTHIFTLQHLPPLCRFSVNASKWQVDFLAKQEPQARKFHDLYTDNQICTLYLRILYMGGSSEQAITKARLHLGQEFHHTSQSLEEQDVAERWQLPRETQILRAVPSGPLGL